LRKYGQKYCPRSDANRAGVTSVQFLRAVQDGTYSVVDGTIPPITGVQQFDGAPSVIIKDSSDRIGVSINEYAYYLYSSAIDAGANVSSYAVTASSVSALEDAIGLWSGSSPLAATSLIIGAGMATVLYGLL
jgi:hypothetical protein